MTKPAFTNFTYVNTSNRFFSKTVAVREIELELLRPNNIFIRNINVSSGVEVRGIKGRLTLNNLPSKFDLIILTFFEDSEKKIVA